MNSMMMGAAMGAMGGPIGLGVGAVVGLIRGLTMKSQFEKQAKNEMTRQEQIDKELERQIEAKQQGATRSGMGASSGLLLVEDHLAPERETAPTQAPSTPPSAGEGLVMLADNTAPPKPIGSPPTQIQVPSPVVSPEIQTGEEEGQETAQAQRALEEQLAAARERQRTLHAALQGTPAPSKTPRFTGIPATEPPPTTDSEGFRPVFNGDKRPDIIRYYDETGRLVRQEEDSRLDGRLDTWTFHEAGRAVRKESDTNGDGKVDLWVFYDAAGNIVRTEADSDSDNHRDHVIVYAQGEMVEEQRYSPGLEPPRFIATYANGIQTRKAEDTDGNGRMNRMTEYDGSGHVTKIARDTTGGGTFNQFAYYESESGKVDVISYFEKGRLVRREFFDLPEDGSVKAHVPLPSVPSER
jgi:antitoxin component YwqK of YwqJK toxin-antitoxin module